MQPAASATRSLLGLPPTCPLPRPVLPLPPCSARRPALPRRPAGAGCQRRDPWGLPRSCRALPAGARGAAGPHAGGGADGAPRGAFHRGERLCSGSCSGGGRAAASVSAADLNRAGVGLKRAHLGALRSPREHQLTVWLSPPACSHRRLPPLRCALPCRPHRLCTHTSMRSSMEASPWMRPCAACWPASGAGRRGCRAPCAACLPARAVAHGACLPAAQQHPPPQPHPLAGCRGRPRTLTLFYTSLLTCPAALSFLPCRAFFPALPRRLPGEAQKIDRIMEKFAERFCRDNPQAFKNGAQPPLPPGCCTQPCRSPAAAPTPAAGMSLGCRHRRNVLGFRAFCAF